MINFETNDEIAIIRLSRNPENLLNIEMMEELSLTYKKIEDMNNIRAVILTSNIDGFFCNGLDIEYLLNSDKEGKLKIFKALYDLSAHVYEFKKLNISLLNGHTMAGGAVLAAMTDFRFFVEGPYRFNFSEVKIGLGIPEAFLRIIESIASSINIRKTALLAEAYKPAEALTAGLIDDIFSKDEAIEKTKKFAKKVLTFPDKSYQKTKYNLRKSNIEFLKENNNESLETFSDFFDENFTEALLAIKEKRRTKFNFKL
ncbi:MAG: enoyl-CoA hydratase/isomerase family protein [Spirochaetia bacterium]|nr:enoyl-CoA hydratase/isomerase family protein [Spirochaetia bacterium]